MSDTFEMLRINPEDLGSAQAVHDVFHAELDAAITEEFSGNVTRYRAFVTVEQTQARLFETFTGTPPRAVGITPMIDGAPVGLALGGPKDFEDESRNEQRGINMSGWLLPQSRGMGLGKKLFEECTKQLLIMRAAYPDREHWGDRVMWTSIHQDNTASQRACEAVGFERAHRRRKEGREEDFAYILPEEVCTRLIG